jgi:HD-GYP domain-containing protein (c-di-GMP phosphodiesterase class II)
VLHAEAHGETLAAEDQALIDNAPQLCAELIGQLDGYGTVADTVLYHRERIDGSGYPAGLIGKEIPLTSRILAVCCVYDAMHSRSDYRPPMSEPEAMTELRVAAERGQLDPELVEAFIALRQRKGPEFEQHTLTTEGLDIRRHSATPAADLRDAQPSRPQSR